MRCTVGDGGVFLCGAKGFVTDWDPSEPWAEVAFPQADGSVESRRVVAGRLRNLGWEGISSEDPLNSRFRRTLDNGDRHRLEGMRQQSPRRRGFSL